MGAEGKGSSEDCRYAAVTVGWQGGRSPGRCGIRHAVRGPVAYIFLCNLMRMRLTESASCGILASSCGFGMITQKEIAKRLDVSQALVSRVLAGKGDRIGVATETAERIRKLARRLDYRPSAAAQSLRGGPSLTLGVIVKHFGDPFFGQMIAELRSVAHLARYSIVLASYEPNAGEYEDAGSLLRHRVDKLVLCGSNFPDALVQRFVASGASVVQIGVGPAPRGAALVSVDEGFGLERVVAHLRQLGHRDIGFLGNAAAANRRRHAAVRHLLAHDALCARPDWAVTTTGNPADAGYLGVQRLMDGTRRRFPTALIAADDMIALGALRALHEKGLKVPGDISVTGFDDVPFASLSVPALTTVRQPIRDMVRAACELLDDSVSWVAGSVRLVRPEVIIRESSGVPRKKGI